MAIFQPVVCFSWRINNIAKSANSANNGSREIELGRLYGANYSEYIDLTVVEVSNIFATKGAFFFVRESFDSCYIKWLAVNGQYSWNMTCVLASIMNLTPFCLTCNDVLNNPNFRVIDASQIHRRWLICHCHLTRVWWSVRKQVDWGRTTMWCCISSVTVDTVLSISYLTV